MEDMSATPTLPGRFTAGLVVNQSLHPRHTFHTRLFQTRMWLDYAMTWHGKRTMTGVDQKWCEQIGRLTYAGCKRRARVNLYLAHRLLRTQS